MNAAEAQAFRNVTVLIVGDYMLDNYIGGNVERISPEAPIPVLNVTWERTQLGGAGNVVNNLQALSAKTRVLSCIGQDPDGDNLVAMLSQSGADTLFLQRSDAVTTIRKTRVVAKSQQVVRIDWEKGTWLPTEFFEYVTQNLDDIFSGVDILLLSDYGKGTLTFEMTQMLIKKAREVNIPVLVDPKGSDWEKYRGATMCTPNLKELSVVCGTNFTQTMEAEIREAAHDLCKQLEMDYLLVTRSEKGMSLISKDGVKADYPAKEQEVIDVSGAGDTVISTMALGMVAGFDMGACCRLANEAAAIVVSKFGTATVSIEELIGAELFSARKKRITKEDAGYLSKFLHEHGKRIVFTNGCFDLVHAGHVFSLEQAKSHGDVLVVGINSDASVKRLKGELRPVVNENDRAYLLQSLGVVDYVIIFDEDTPAELIQAVQPDVLVKGKDYEGKEVVGSEVVHARGGKVELIDLKAGLSTTAIIQKIRTAYQDGE